MNQTSHQKNELILSNYTQALLESIDNLPQRHTPDEISRLTVSRAVSFLAILYEKVRNAIEYREEHLVRRAAIERIIRRRLALNPSGKNEAENILRELTWARYYNNGSLGEEDIILVQKIIDIYQYARNYIISGRNKKQGTFLSDFIFDMMTCEIEESLNPKDTHEQASYTYYIYQTLRNKVAVTGISEEQKDVYFLSALEQSFRKSDISYRRYHLFSTFYKPLITMSPEELKDIVPKLPEIFSKVDGILHNPFNEKLAIFIRKQLPPYLILFSLLEKFKEKSDQIIASKSDLWREVEHICRQKYSETQSKLRILAIKSLVYIFATKMVFAIILEYPLTLWIYNEVHALPIIINSLFPPVLMLIIVLLFKLPGEENTKRIYSRITQIVDADESFETRKSINLSGKQQRNPILAIGFSVFYAMTFFITLIIIFFILRLMHFNIISEFLFIFFVSVVSFFAFRIKQVVNRYRLVERESIITPLVDFFFMPLLAIGKFFSEQVGKLNIFIVIFDFFIEAPFKLIIEVIEQWISYVRQRKEEIV